jgi:MFS transporter, MCT family, solute carrier family 16 (monocarboxylic acid transporters), member 10
MFKSFRMGFAFTVVAFAMLLGTPIEGALVGDDFQWLRAIVFCGVRFF